MKPSQSARADRLRSDGIVIFYLAFLGMMMATGIDIALPALDEINADLGGGGSESLLVTVYVVGAAFGQLVVGPVSDAIGRRRVVLSGLALYTAGAVAAALAPSFGVLLAARFVWGVGAAAPTGMRSAIARDLYSGDKMARVTTIMMAVFMLGPIFTPLIGEGLLAVGSWPVVFWFAALMGVATMAATSVFGETLAPERRRPLNMAEFGQALRVILRTRVTLGHILANIFWNAAFFIFLGSAQPIIDRVFGRVEHFALYFALLGTLTIPPLLINNVVIRRIGARSASLGAGSVAAATAIFGVIWVVAVDATPSFWSWFFWLVTVTTATTLAYPPQHALALEPMGDLAGTVSSLLFFTGFALGSLLSEVFSRQVDDRVLPFVAGMALYASIGLGFQLWARSEPTG